jgi:hypothetical protein
VQSGRSDQCTNGTTATDTKASMLKTLNGMTRCARRPRTLSCDSPRTRSTRPRLCPESPRRSERPLGCRGGSNGRGNGKERGSWWASASARLDACARVVRGRIGLLLAFRWWTYARSPSSGRQYEHIHSWPM